jgi:hypothetical protein
MAARKSPTPGQQWSSEHNYQLPKELLEKFYKEIDKLRIQMFGKDCDGDCPVSVHVIDRTRCEPNHFFDIPYRHKIEESEVLTEEEKAVKLEERLDLLLCNVSVATERLNGEVTIRRHHRLRQEQVNKAYAEGAKANKAGVPLKSNPYSKKDDMDCLNAWREGWVAQTPSWD